METESLPDNLVQVAPTDATLPYLSHSRISRYLLCPQQYKYHYVENLRPRVPSASLQFGSTIHNALAEHFQQDTNPVETFQNEWAVYEQETLRYSGRETWAVLLDRGQALLSEFMEQHRQRITNVIASELEFSLSISGIEERFEGIVDLVADLDGVQTVIDFKTSGSVYQDWEVELSDQLTAYQLAWPQAQQSAFCVLVKTKEPRIEWHVAKRAGQELQEYLHKANLVGGHIKERLFYRRPGRQWCGQCDFLSPCLRLGC